MALCVSRGVDTERASARRTGGHRKSKYLNPNEEIGTEEASSAAYPARRTIVCAEARSWLAANEAPAGASVVTSMPDVSEFPKLGFDGWRHWFIATAQQIMRWVPDDGVAIFFQSDVRHDGIWVDKGFLVMTAALAEGRHLVWHKIACRKPPGTITPGRASYSHLLCFAKNVSAAPRRPGPDVLADAGYQSWPRAMGDAACRLVCRYLRDETATRVVVDPFCGEGAMLAAANAAGFEAIGVDLSQRRCRIALEVTDRSSTAPALAETRRPRT